jgi:hypothetical protein
MNIVVPMNPAVIDPATPEQPVKVPRSFDSAPGPAKAQVFSKPAMATAVGILAVLSGLAGIIYVFLGETTSAFSLFAACLSLFAWGAMIEYLAKIAFHAERAADALTAPRS